MPYNYKSPGVYIEEVERGARPIEQAGTAVVAALDQQALFEQLRTAFALECAAGFTLPVIAQEGCAVLGLQRADNAGLQRQQVVANLLGEQLPRRICVLRRHRLMARKPMSPRYCAPSKWMPCSTS